MRGGEEVDESWSAEEETRCSLCFVHVQGCLMHACPSPCVMRQRAISQLVCSSSCKGHYMYININAWA